MYNKLPNLVLGFHGCNTSVFEKVILDNQSLDFSKNSYDWLGNGIYFWEQNLERAVKWAKDKHKEDYAVIGALIDLGNCLNLAGSRCLDIVRKEYIILKEELAIANIPLPENKNIYGNKDKILRFLDCKVIESLCNRSLKQKEFAFDSVRGMFLEGEDIYEGSGFKSKTHIQICVRNPNCIKGYFTPRDINQDYPIP